MRHRAYYYLCLLLVVLDQLTKQTVVSIFDLGESVIVNPYLSLTYVQNYGAGFSILASGTAIQKGFLLAVSITASCLIIFWIYKTLAIYRQRLFGQFFLLSGALGNLLDRAQYGYVIDFIDSHYGQYHWPVFNLADSFIFVGVALIIFERRLPST